MANLNTDVETDTETYEITQMPDEVGAIISNQAKVILGKLKSILTETIPRHDPAFDDLCQEGASEGLNQAIGQLVLNGFTFISTEYSFGLAFYCRHPDYISNVSALQMTINIERYGLNEDNFLNPQKDLIYIPIRQEEEYSLSELAQIFVNEFHNKLDSIRN